MKNPTTDIIHNNINIYTTYLPRVYTLCISCVFVYNFFQTCQK